MFPLGSGGSMTGSHVAWGITMFRAISVYVDDDTISTICAGQNCCLISTEASTCIDMELYGRSIYIEFHASM